MCSLGLNETVTWRGRHFGLMLTQETQITRYERPDYFQDTMLPGLFASFVHDHYFEVTNGITRMRDHAQLRRATWDSRSDRRAG